MSNVIGPPHNLVELLTKQVIAAAEDEIRDRVSRLHCPEHSQSPRITGSGRQLSATCCCEKLEALVRQALS